MAKVKRYIKDSIVIVCEGTETEPPYFGEVVAYINDNTRFEKIKVIPTPEPVTGRKNKQESRKISGTFYHSISEKSSEEYERYKAQPTRYVREAYLYLQSGTYNIAWAVFDKEGHPDHKFAFDCAKMWGVQIAFSSYCFEEWLLLHFEKNMKPFLRGDCHEGKGIKCGEGCEEDCYGNSCLAGYIRKKNYIPNYRKNRSGVFERYTLPNLEKAMINAAWSRRNKSEREYLQNPYCTVDKLVAFLLARKYYEWHFKEFIEIAKDIFKVDVEESGILKIYNLGSSRLFVSKDWAFCDKNGTIIEKFPKSLIIAADGEATIGFVPSKATLLRIEDNEVVHIIEIKN